MFLKFLYSFTLHKQYPPVQRISVLVFNMDVDVWWVIVSLCGCLWCLRTCGTTGTRPMLEGLLICLFVWLFGQTTYSNSQIQRTIQLQYLIFTEHDCTFRCRWQKVCWPRMTLYRIARNFRGRKFLCEFLGFVAICESFLCKI